MVETWNHDVVIQSQLIQGFLLIRSITVIRSLTSFSHVELIFFFSNRWQGVGGGGGNVSNIAPFPLSLCQLSLVTTLHCEAHFLWFPPLGIPWQVAIVPPPPSLRPPPPPRYPPRILRHNSKGVKQAARPCTGILEQGRRDYKFKVPETHKGSWRSMGTEEKNYVPASFDRHSVFQDADSLSFFYLGKAHRKEEAGGRRTVIDFSTLF